jgi:hypothetical protein
VDRSVPEGQRACSEGAARLAKFTSRAGLPAIARIHELRRQHSARVSDEALEEIAYLTRLMELSLTSAK